MTTRDDVPPSWFDRLVEEQRLLKEKCAKLDHFLKSDGIHAMQPEEASRLVRQMDAMEVYCAILGDRIAAGDDEPAIVRDGRAPSDRGPDSSS